MRFMRQFNFMPGDYLKQAFASIAHSRARRECNAAVTCGLLNKLSTEKI